MYKNRLRPRCPELCFVFAGGTGNRMADSSKIQLFVKASEDGESIGHCPSCQRLFMILLLKGVPFTLTTVDTKRSPDVLKDFAPGAQLPVLLYDGAPQTDTLKIEEFLEKTLRPPNFPSLAPRYKESTVAGNDVFHRFSAYIKNPIPAQDEALQKNLRKALLKLDRYLSLPLDYELLRDPTLAGSRRRFLDGDQMTLADCALLPKLNIAHVVCCHYRQSGIPEELRGIWRYLDGAAEAKEFKYSCPNREEIVQAYRRVVRPPRLDPPAAPDHLCPSSEPLPHRAPFSKTQNKPGSVVPSRPSGAPGRAT